MVHLIPGQDNESDSPARLTCSRLTVKASLVKTDFRAVWSWILAEKAGKTHSGLLKK